MCARCVRVCVLSYACVCVCTCVRDACVPRSQVRVCARMMCVSDTSRAGLSLCLLFCFYTCMLDNCFGATNPLDRQHVPLDPSFAIQHAQHATTSTYSERPSWSPKLWRKNDDVSTNGNWQSRPSGSINDWHPINASTSDSWNQNGHYST